MITATKKKQSIYPRNTSDFGDVRVACPIYIGVSTELSKKILDCLRTKCGEVPTSTGSFSTVTHSGITQSQKDLENRLRIDLKTLRMVLMGSMSRGINLDLALRLQQECGGDVQFINPSVVEDAIKSAIQHYEFFADKTNAETAKH
jgi:hypothetical protein